MSWHTGMLFSRVVIFAWALVGVFFVAYICCFGSGCGESEYSEWRQRRVFLYSSVWRLMKVRATKDINFSFLQSKFWAIFFLLLNIQSLRSNSEMSRMSSGTLRCCEFWFLMDVFVVLSTAHGNAERHGCPVRLSELQGFCGMLIAELLN